MNGYLVWCPALGQTQADGEVFIAGAPRQAAGFWAGRWGNLRPAVSRALTAAPSAGDGHSRKVVYEVQVAGNGRALDYRNPSKSPWGPSIACTVTVELRVEISAVAPLRSRSRGVGR